MSRAVISGSFDPVTTGHLDLVKTALDIFGSVTIVILANAEKGGGMFRPAERLELVNLMIETEHLEGADAIIYGGLTSDACRELGAKYIVRGARCASDFDYEYSLSQIMKRFDPSLETIILPPVAEHQVISSTYVRELLKYKSDLKNSVPDGCIERMLEIVG